MDFAQVLVVLWRRRWWVALGSVLAVVVALSTGYHLSFFPPSLKAKSLAIGTADTQLLVDTEHSSLLNVNGNELPLVQRAAVLAPLMTTLPVREAIARAAGVPASQIYVSAPLSPYNDIYAQEPTAAQRSQQILGQNLGLRLNVSSNQDLPTIAITAQAPSAQDAVRLANAAAVGFISYLRQSEKLQRIRPGARTILRQLGSAEGGTIGGGTKVALVAVTFVGVLIGWMILVVLGSSVAENLRRIRAEGPAGGEQSA